MLSQEHFDLLQCSHVQVKIHIHVYIKNVPVFTNLVSNQVCQLSSRDAGKVTQGQEQSVLRVPHFNKQTGTYKTSSIGASCSAEE